MRLQVSSVVIASLALMASIVPVLAALPSEQSPQLPEMHRLKWLIPGPGNPRNSEGAFLKLKDGRLFFAYSKFLGSDGGDYGHAIIAARYSSDGGHSWTSDDKLIVQGEGNMNVMSVSLLRLKDGRIALFYGRKNSTSDCHFYLRYSTDETKTWSEPILTIAEPGYYVMNNDRAIQLKNGRILLPIALHLDEGDDHLGPGAAMTYISDDAGKTWRRSSSQLRLPEAGRAGLQEPGIVELKNGTLLMFIRTQLGSQYLSYSKDHGDTWTPPQPSAITSPLSNAEIKRIPSTRDLLLVWNDHSRIDPSFRASPQSGGKRTPVSVAISRDEGKSWIHVHHLLADPNGWYSYFAVYFVDNQVLLAFCATGKDQPKLSETDIVSFPVSALYSGGIALKDTSDTESKGTH
ncbi:MAG: exo-alpha-sialidase [Acidobacteria bacterium]|nr:exo-alpha-sialidase [Acidobacteriota bacterium]